MIERLKSKFDGWTVPKELQLSSLAIVVGMISALGASLLMWLILRLTALMHWGQQSFGWLGVLSLMGVAGFISGLIMRRSCELRGSGIPYVMEAMAIRSGRVPFSIAPLKTLTTSITIGVGGSAGREGPIVQIGASLGSFVGQMFHLSTKRVRILAACGAAAGIAAAFNTPIAGTIFALEIILASFTTRYFGTVVLSSVSGSIVSRMIWGSQPAFQVPPYPLHHIGEIPIYIALAVLAAVVAVYWTKSLIRVDQGLSRLQRFFPLRTALGLVLTGCLAWAFARPEILGSGLESISVLARQNHELTIGVLASLLVLKILATALTVGSGNAGGVLAPSLFLGATLGGIVGTLAHKFVPGIAPNPGAYIIVGMAGVFAASTRAPMTAVLMVFELSNDYRLIVPLMMVTVLATFIAEGLFDESVYSWPLSKKGISLQNGRDLHVLEGLLVEDTMATDYHATPASTTLAELSDLFMRTHWHGTMVLDEDGKLCGIITVNDLDRAVANKLSPDTPISDIATPYHKLQVVYPDDTVGDALAEMGQRGFGLLPVVDREDPHRPVGMMERKELISSYNRALTRRSEVKHRTQRRRLTLDGTEFIDIPLHADHPVVGKTISELGPSLPYDCILVSIRRGDSMLIPHGNTTLQEGDLLTAFVCSQDVDKLFHGLKGETQPNSGPQDNT
ncbi:MAG: CBS domain-containing protein [Deltaproteobacteria bacterium]|nr:MAG: CBS domain-containing protein [Deltaproteobacteria bacterium]